MNEEMTGNGSQFFTMRGLRPIFNPYLLALHLKLQLTPLCYSIGPQSSMYHMFYVFRDQIWRVFTREGIAAIACDLLQEHARSSFIEEAIKLLEAMAYEALLPDVTGSSDMTLWHPDLGASMGETHQDQGAT